jgi:uncharacterized protein YjiS (DUF1127 family)
MFATLSTIFRPAVAKRPSATRPGAPVLRLLRAWARDSLRYFVRRADVRRLHELSDRELRDIGLARGQVEAAAYGFITRPDWTSM